MKNILIIGCGGREYAIAKAIKRDNPNVSLFYFGAYENPGLIQLCKSHLGNNPKELVKLIKKNTINMAVIGPEVYLKNGIVDLLEKNGVKCVGPKKELAQLETSKLFTRYRMLFEWDLADYLPYFDTFVKLREDDFNYPHAFADSYDLSSLTKDQILNIILRLNGNYVIKADGLKSGKGVRVSGDHLHSIDDAYNYCLKLKEHGDEFLIEEKLEGNEFSLMSFCDGKTLKSMPIVQDFKRAYNNDKGPNTGGMGSISHSNHRLSFLTKQDIEEAHTINEKVIDGIQSETKQKYKGIIYGSFMKTFSGKIKVIEYNCRFGDPECINILELLKTNFLTVLEAIVDGTLDELDIEYEKTCTVCRYLVPDGYPNNPVQNREIHLGEVDKSMIIYSSVFQKIGKIFLKGSRTIAVISKGETLYEAATRVEKEIAKIKGPMFSRIDIGKDSISYKSSGVDIEKGNQVVDNIQKHVKSTYNENSADNYGDFGGMFKFKGDFLVSSTDGVGTKSILAQQVYGNQAFLNLGKDLVNHCVNDILVKGAKPLFFLDYFASNKLDCEQVELFVEGLSLACKEVNCVLIGGETAEMPGIYQENKSDLVGTIVGSVENDKVFDGKKNIKSGDVIFGLKSVGPHTNGFTLVRKLIELKKIDLEFAQKLLKPHKCYFNDIQKILHEKIKIKGLCHITGGGLVENPKRVLSDGLSIKWMDFEIPEIFLKIQEVSNIDDNELKQVFNCGIGMLIFVSNDDKDKMTDLFEKDYLIELGEVELS